MTDELKELFLRFVEGYRRDMLALHLRFERLEEAIRPIAHNHDHDKFWNDVWESKSKDTMPRDGLDTELDIAKKKEGFMDRIQLLIDEMNNVTK